MAGQRMLVFWWAERMLLMLCIVVIEQESVNYGLQAASSRDHMWPPPKQKLYYLALYRKFANSCHMLWTWCETQSMCIMMWNFKMVSTFYCQLVASLIAQSVRNLPAMQETWVRFLGQEDPLEKEMATHSSTLTWKILWMEEPGRLQSKESQRVRHDRATSLYFNENRILSNI